MEAQEQLVMAMPQLHLVMRYLQAALIATSTLHAMNIRGPHKSTQRKRRFKTSYSKKTIPSAPNRLINNGLPLSIAVQSRFGKTQHSEIASQSLTTPPHRTKNKQSVLSIILTLPLY